MIFEKIQLEEDEEILTLTRRHWFSLFIQSLFVFLLIILPIAFVLAFFTFAPQQANAAFATYYPHFLFLYSLFLLINWMLLASFFTDYYLDIWCITNKRIIKIDQVTLFKRKTGSFRLERMQDVNVEINGIIATFLDYGTVHIQTASADLEEFKGTFLPKPQDLKAVILQAADKRIDNSGL